MKVIMPDYIGPYGLVLLRVITATVLFNLCSLFFSKERIENEYYLRIVAATAFGMCLNMVFFIRGLSLSTPINSSVIITIMPIIVMLLSAIFLREKITSFKLLGIVFGFSGALTWVLYGNAFIKNAPNILGNAMMLINAFSYGAYYHHEAHYKKIPRRYPNERMFPLGVMNLPFAQELLAVTGIRFHLMPCGALALYSFTTFLAYLLNMYALREVPPTTIGVLTYVQPIIAILCYLHRE